VDFCIQYIEFTIIGSVIVTFSSIQYLKNKYRLRITNNNLSSSLQAAILIKISNVAHLFENVSDS